MRIDDNQRKTGESNRYIGIIFRVSRRCGKLTNILKSLDVGQMAEMVRILD